MNKQTTIYFGANIGTNNLTVSDSSFAHFIRLNVEKRLPSFTLTTGQGYWNGESETVRILTVLHSGEACALAVDIAQIYAARYSQESVLIVTSDIRSAFISA